MKKANLKSSALKKHTLFLGALSLLSFRAEAAGQEAGMITHAALSNAGQLGSAASSLAQAMGGANAAAQGNQELSCCMQGCQTGAGSNAAATNAANNAAAAATGAGIKAAFPARDKIRHGTFLIDPKWQERKNQPCGTGFQIPGVWLKNFLFPQKAEANGCADAMQALQQAAQMLMQALQALMAAKQGQDQQNTSATNAAKMSEITKYDPTSTNLGKGAATGASIKVDPALLRTGAMDKIATSFENNFGISRDDFANSFLNGEDPRKILMNAPKNAISADVLNKAFAGAMSLPPDASKEMMEKYGVSAVQREMTAQVANAEVSLVATAGGPSRKPANTELDDLSDQLKLLENGLANGLNPALDERSKIPGLSADVQAALEQRELAERNLGHTNLTLFQVVHNKYQEKIRMIFGQGIPGKKVSSGVAGVDGY